MKYAKRLRGNMRAMSVLACVLSGLCGACWKSASRGPDAPDAAVLDSTVESDAVVADSAVETDAIVMPGDGELAVRDLETDDAVLVPLEPDNVVATMAAGDGVVLAVWYAWPSGVAPVSATLVTAEGEVLHPRGLPLPEGIHHRAAFDGTDFVVASQPGTYANTGDIVLTRISTRGEVGSPRVVVSTGLSHHLRGFACGPEVCLVTWRQSDKSYELRAARVDRAGVRDRGGILLDPHVLGDGGEVAWNGSSFVVAWTSTDRPPENGFALWAVRIDADGNVLDPDRVRVAARASYVPDPQLAGINGQVAMIWSDNSVAEPALTAARLDSDGEVEGVDTLVQGAGFDPIRMSIGSGAGRYLVAWNTGAPDRDLVGRWLDADGTLGTSTMALLDAVGPYDGGEIAAIGDRFFVGASARGPAFDYDTRAVLTRVETDGVLDDVPRALAFQSNRQERPVLVAGRDRPLLMWSDDLGTGRSYCAATPDLALPTLGPASSTVPASFHMWTPVVGGSGDQWLAAWINTENAALLVTRYDADGLLLDDPPIELARMSFIENTLAVASDGDRYLVVWHEETEDRRERLLFGALIGRDGEVIAPRLPLRGPSPGPRSVAATWTGTHYMLVWTDGADVQLERIDADGAVLDDVPAIIPSVEMVWYVRVASPGGGRAAVLWRTENRRAAFGVWTDQQGVLAAGTEFTVSVPTDHYLDGATLSTAGDDVVVALNYHRQRYTIAAARVQATGQVLGPYPLHSARIAFDPQMAEVGPRSQLLVYTHRDDPALAPLRVRGRRFEIRAPGGACETGFECSSGICNAAICQ